MSRYMYVKKINNKPPKIKLNARKRTRVAKKRFNYGAMFLIFVGGFFVIIAISPIINYYIDQNIFHQYQTKIVNADPNASYFSQIIQAENFQKNNTYTGYFHISIPTINLNNVPVKSEVDGFNTNAYEKILVNSLAQMKGTALPGQVGNVYIYGHSAPQWFADLYPSSFLGIFTNILQLKIGDKIFAKFKGENYTYEVFQTQVVSPNDISVLQYPPGKRYLTLMTCIPPGIGTQRFIVKAKLIS